ncbi:MAG: SpoIIIAC/SpoIIIAD family protein [Bacillota bacterium]|nr:SpoIIIAC/SpoIIIAD family protein [Bacillota bacterium]NLU55126.1 stage III sporulation protein AC [Bacillota bacterium]HOA90796.1 SpoIIIAC/SpoIIIAD family protein [Bacillota bacterium]HOJ45726.1 SpoIIIAC/SpoIIIAD family protein [Bacillota bacterium]HOP53275.1 SpoIIIAC/SpoIIIAD family protein [Bacillota bacterium]
MQIGVIMQLVGLGIIAAVVHIVLKQAGKEDIALIVTIGAVVIGFILILDEISRLFSSIRLLFGL